MDRIEAVTILAIDPGKRTGWAELRHGLFSSGQTDGDDYLVWLGEALSEGIDPTAVVIEDFIYTEQTAKKTRQTWSTEAIGVVRFLCRKHGIPLTIQTPADAKRFSTDAKLRTMDWYRPSKGGHANDAARHLLLYCAKHTIITPDQLI